MEQAWTRPRKVHALHRSPAATMPTPGVLAWPVRTMAGADALSPDSSIGRLSGSAQATAVVVRYGGGRLALISNRYSRREAGSTGLRKWRSKGDGDGSVSLP